LTWITSQRVAALLGVSVRAVQTAKTKYEHRYVKGKGRGGKQLQIALESLPQEAQDRYHGMQLEPVDVFQFTGKQRENADWKAFIVLDYQHSSLSPDDYVLNHNSREPEDAISTSQLFRWQKKYKQGGVTALIDQRGGHNRGRDTIPADAWEFFYNLYMTQQKRSVSLCYDIAKGEYHSIPSVSAFERKVRQIPYAALTLYRDGEKAFNDKCLPSMERTKLDILSNDVWFSDHHACDVFVKNADGAKIIRPWLTVFLMLVQTRLYRS